MIHRLFKVVIVAVIFLTSSLAHCGDENSSDELSLDTPTATDSASAPEAASPDASTNESDLSIDTTTENPSTATEAIPENNLAVPQNATTEDTDAAANSNLASPIDIRQSQNALFGFSAGLIVSSQPFIENYNVTSPYPNINGRKDRATEPIQSAGIIMRYAIAPFYGLGTDLNVSYLKSQNHSLITIQDTSTLNETTTLKGEVNLTYAIDLGGVLPVYFLAGFGAQRVSGTEIEKIINRMGYGGQAGGGFVINSTLNFEAVYSYYVHRVSQKVIEDYRSPAKKGIINFEDAQMINQGLAFRGTYSFNF